MVSEQGFAASEPIMNNEVRISPEKASDGAKTSIQVGTEPHARTGSGVLKKLIRGPRYFNGYGESDDEGKPKRWHKRCYMCGGASHVGKRCKKVTPCFICSKTGHLVVDCPDKKLKVDCASMPCLRCGKTGHDMFSCTDEYDPEDLKVIECYVCKHVGHLCCGDEKAEGPREASCYNCGQSGHFGLECTNLNEVGSNLQLSCRKCKERGHSKKQCPKAKSAKKDGAKTKAEKRKARNARRRMKTMQTPSGNASQPNRPPFVGPYYARPPTGYQTNGVWWPPIVGPYYGRPRANVWLSPAAAAAIPNQQVYHNQVGGQAVASFGPLTGFPYPQIRTQITQLPINQGIGIMLPQTATVPNWHYERRTILLQPHVNQQTGIRLPQTESGAMQNSLGYVDPTSLPNMKPTFG